MQWSTIVAIVFAAIKSAWSGGSPFAVQTVLYPLNEENKYIIESEGVRLAFTLNGGALSNLWINDTHGVERDIVLGFDQADDVRGWVGNPWLNGVIGRVAGFLRDPDYEINSVRYTIATDRPDRTVYNGGETGWGRRVLDVASHSQNSITFVVFDRGWGGFPGKPAGCITHTVTPYEWQLSLGLVAVHSPTPVSLSQQVFWNLDGFSSSSTKTVLDHTLKLPYSGLRFAVDQDGVPTGDILSNPENSAFDFWSKHQRIGDSLKDRSSHTRERYRQLDDTFLVMRPQPWKMEDGPAAILSSEHSGIQVELFTNQEALHVHTWKSGPDSVDLKKGQGQGRVPDFGAVSMEMQNWPDSLHHPEWQRQHETILGTNRIYGGYSTFKFSVD
ncbi:putative aldose 1-epimerase family protein [Hypoxylon cercidicola]|nr:putative aldose 1-epimerase family protein [Hypoxylon cercidicola]